MNTSLVSNKTNISSISAKLIEIEKEKSYKEDLIYK